MSPRWGSTPRLTDWLTVGRNVTLTLPLTWLITEEVNLGRNTDYPDWCFHGFGSPSIRPRPLPSKLFPVKYSSVILPSTVYSLNTDSRNLPPKWRNSWCFTDTVRAIFNFSKRTFRSDIHSGSVSLLGNSLIYWELGPLAGGNELTGSIKRD
jgi:hypothetical protein